MGADQRVRPRSEKIEEKKKTTRYRSTNTINVATTSNHRGAGYRSINQSNADVILISADTCGDEDVCSVSRWLCSSAIGHDFGPAVQHDLSNVDGFHSPFTATGAAFTKSIDTYLRPCCLFFNF